MAARLRIVLSGLLLACSCEARGLRISTAVDAGNIGGTIMFATGDAGASAAAGTTGSTGGATGSTGTASTTVLKGVFVPTGSMTAARESHTATLLPSGMVLIAGGAFYTAPLPSAELYNPAAGTFTATGNMTTYRDSHTATLLPSGKVLIAGGADDNGTALASAELYDPATATFTATGNMTAARSGHTATLLGNGKVLIAGGTSGYHTTFASAELYDPATATFTATGNMTAARSGHTATLLGNGKVLIAGGVSWDATTYDATTSASAELYNPSAGKFTATGSMTVARQQHTATLLNDGRVLIAGGESIGVVDFNLASAELYNPGTGTFTAIGNIATYRENHTATLLDDGKVLVAGGDAINGASVNLVELYDPSAGTFTATGSMTVARRYHTATLLGNGEVLIAGGDGYDGGVDRIRASAELYE
jgi:hypothetical protein